MLVVEPPESGSRDGSIWSLLYKALILNHSNSYRNLRTFLHMNVEKFRGACFSFGKR